MSSLRNTNVLGLLLNCAPGPPTLPILVRASFLCSVKGVVHCIVRDLQFLGNFSHGLAFISQNKNRVSGHFEPVIEPTHADAPDTTSLKKASFIASLIRTTVSAVLT